MHRMLLRGSVVAATAGALVAAALGTGSASAAGSSPAATLSTPAASAPVPGQWTQATAAGPLNFADIGLVRGRDGVLHVLWTSGSTGTYRISDTPITWNGVVGQPVTIASHLYLATFPDATATPAGLDVFWNGAASSALGSPEGTYEATRPVSAGSWRRSGIVTPAVATNWDFGVSAATGSDGKPWVAFGDAGGFEVLHYGHPKQKLSVPGCCVYNEGIGVDGSSGTPWLTYYSNMTNQIGIFAQQLTQAGARVGPARRLPGSAAGGDALPVNQRVPAAGRGAGRGGVYVTYLSGWPTAHAVDLIRLGAKSPVTVSTLSGTSGSTVTADPKGRLWVAWYRGYLDASQLFVRLSNATVSAFGTVHRVPLPSGTSELWKVYLSAQAGRVDVLALLTVRGKIAYWTTQVLPPK